MVGTIFGLGLSQQFNGSGEPYVGALLYIYEAGTSTAVTVYKDFSLTTGNEHPHPIVADALGRIPAFWLNDGSYRVRLTDADGNELFDEDSVAALGDSSTTTVTSSVPSEALLKTGDMMATFNSGTRTGWVRCNGNTIGNSSSSATERANADTEALFTFLWNNISDTYAPVSTGRGASAAADFAASKTIQLPDFRGRAYIGLDDMGATAAGNVAAAVTNAIVGGVESFIMTEAQMPAHTHSDGTLSVASHTHSDGTLKCAAHTHDDGTLVVDSHTHGPGTLQYQRSLSEQTESGSNQTVGSNSFANSTLNSGGVTGATAPGISGNTGSASPDVTGATGASAPDVEGATGSTGSGDSISLVQPYIAGYWFVKL